MGKSTEMQKAYTPRHTGGRARRGHGQLEIMAQQKGVPIIEVVKDALRSEHSIYGAAQKLGVSPNTVSYHLRKAGIAFRAIVTIEFFPVEEVVAS
jgi:hypothetical protein